MALVSVGTIPEELESARAHAMKDPKGAAAAVSASLGKAKLHGLLVDKVAKTDKDGEDLPETETSARELAKAISYLRAKGLKAKAAGG